MIAVVRALWATFVRRARWVDVGRLDHVSNDGRLLPADRVTVPESVPALRVPRTDDEHAPLMPAGLVPLRVTPGGWIEAALPRSWGTAASVGVDRALTIDDGGGVLTIGGVIGHVAVGPVLSHAWAGQRER